MCQWHRCLSLFTVCALLASVGGHSFTPSERFTMGDKYKKSRVDATDEFVLLSVRGALFRLRKDTILATNWVLSKILTSEIPWDKTADGQFYVDADPTSFRIILSIISGVLDVAQEASSFSGAELVLLKVTARYLLLEDIAKQIDGIRIGLDKVVTEQEKELSDLRIKAETLGEIEAALEGLQAQVLECNAYMTCRPYNQCGYRSVILGDISTKKGELVCGECGNDISRLRGRNQFPCVYSCERADLATVMCYASQCKSKTQH
jgi:hypothetical protein